MQRGILGTSPATVAFADALGLSLTAEGLEDADQLSRLRELGCDLGQGYYFAKPLPRRTSNYKVEVKD